MSFWRRIPFQPRTPAAGVAKKGNYRVQRKHGVGDVFMKGVLENPWSTNYFELYCTSQRSLMQLRGRPLTT